MNQREKLIELLKENIEVRVDLEGEPGIEVNYEECADILLKNGVTTRCWFPDDKPPENEKVVVIAAEAFPIVGMPYRYTTLGFYTDGKTLVTDSDYEWNTVNVDFEYSKEYGGCIVPEGWWECLDRYGFEEIHDRVIGWMPQPEPPEEG